MNILNAMYSREICERCLAAAGFILMNEGRKGTIRNAARYLNASKSTVHLDLTERLPKIDGIIAKQVEQKLKENKELGHIWGAQATRDKWKNARNKKNEELNLRLRYDRIFEKKYYQENYEKIEKLSREKYRDISILCGCSYLNIVDEACEVLKANNYPLKYLIIARLAGLVEHLGYGYEDISDVSSFEIAEKVIGLVGHDKQEDVLFVKETMNDGISSSIKSVFLISVLKAIETNLDVRNVEQRRECKDYFVHVFTYYDYYLKNSKFKISYVNLVSKLKEKFRITSLEVEELNYLESVYNLSWGYKGSNIIITSEYDEWKLESTHSGIALMHKNKKDEEGKPPTGYHLQRKFRNSKATLVNVFQLIYDHDRYAEEYRIKNSKKVI